jgi:toxin-antitoxin system PIN domain toxin
VFVVDTNLLLYAVNPDSADHDPAYALLEEWRAGDRPWFLTWKIVYEFLRVSTHPSVFSDPLDLPTAREWLRILLESPVGSVLTETELHDQVLDEVLRLHPRLAGNVLHDLHIAVLMREHGVSEIRTADTDFHQFRFLEVVNPLREG